MSRRASISYFLHAAMNLRPPSTTVSTHTSAYNAVAFQSPVMPNAGCRSVRNRVTLSPPHFLRAVNGDGREVYRQSIPIVLVLSDVGLQACALSLMRLQAHVLRTDFQTSAKKIVHRNRTNTTSQDACSYRYEIPARSTLLAWNVWRAVKIPA